MPLFKRKPRPVNALAPPSMEMPAGEEIERSEKATLLQGPEARIRGGLYMTNGRLVFEAEKGEAKWMIVAYDEIREAGLYRWHHAPMGRSSLNQCLCVVTTKGEQVWWDFDEGAEREWMVLVQGHRDALQQLESMDQ